MFDAQTGVSMVLQEKHGASVDAIAFSADGTFLAAGGQAGTVSIWRLEADSAALLTKLENPRVWVDRLRWHPRLPELAFSLGRYAQVWDAVDQSVVATPAYEASSVLDLAWHPSGDYLTLAGNLSVKTWRRDDWYGRSRDSRNRGGLAVRSPFLPTGNTWPRATTIAPCWYGSGTTPTPGKCRGFPGKVRQLAWSAQAGSPLLASASAEGVVVWAKAKDAAEGWTSHVLDLHSAPVTAVAFQPQSTLLATAAEDGWVCLWQQFYSGGPNSRRSSRRVFDPGLVAPGQVLGGGGAVGVRSWYGRG